MALTLTVYRWVYHHPLRLQQLKRPLLSCLLPQSLMTSPSTSRRCVLPSFLVSRNSSNYDNTEPSCWWEIDDNTCLFSVSNRSLLFMPVCFQLIWTQLRFIKNGSQKAKKDTVEWETNKMIILFKSVRSGNGLPVVGPSRLPLVPVSMPLWIVNHCCAAFTEMAVDKWHDL